MCDSERMCDRSTLHSQTQTARHTPYTRSKQKHMWWCGCAGLLGDALESFLKPSMAFAQCHTQGIMKEVFPVGETHFTLVQSAHGA